MTGKSLVIGYGNTLRGDDGIGQTVAQALANEPAFDCATVVVCHQLTPELAEDIAAMDLVVFIDAALGIPPGSVVVREIEGASAPSSGLVHTADPAALLDLAGTLYGRSPQAFLVTVGVGSLALSDALSQAAAAALPAAIAAVRRLVSPPSGEGRAAEQAVSRRVSSASNRPRIRRGPRAESPRGRGSPRGSSS